MRWGVLILFGVFLVSFASAAVPADCSDETVAYLQFNDNALDGYKGHDGSWSSNEDYAPLIVGNGSRFSGGETITISNAADLDFTSAFTVEMWVDAGSSSGSLFRKGGYEIEWVDLGSNLGLVNVTIGGVSINSSNLGSLSSHHVAVVWYSSATSLSLYVDGSEEDSVSLSSTGAVGGDIDIGEDFVGLIDELAIYGSALSGSLIGSHYALGASGKDYCDPSGAGGGSSTKTAFNIGGCNFNIGGDNFGLARGLCSGSPYSGEYFCSEYKENLVTSQWGLGCAMGNVNYDANLNDFFCCPVGDFCNESAGGGSFQCVRRPVNCVDQTTEQACYDASCNWWGGEEGCRDGRRDLSCSSYDNEADCLGDALNLGQVGMGTERCGTIFECNGESFSVSDCGCAWFVGGLEGQKCQVNLVAVQTFYDPVATPDSFECSNVYELGNCTEGKQDVTWSSNSSVVSGFGGASIVPTDCLDELNCNGGEGSRFCGESIIKLPGFSLFALFASLFIIGACCFVKERKIKFK